MSLKVGTPLPAFDGATHWLNGQANAASLIGRPVLVQFWAVSCPICKTNMPALRALQDTYKVQGLQTVAVHMPRSEADTDVEAVTRAVAELGITEPCALDNLHAIGDRYDTGGFWPYYFLFGRDGKMQRHAAGPIGLKLIEAALKRLMDAELVAGVIA